MSDTDIRVRTIIAEELGLPLGAVVPASHLRDDLGVDAEDLTYLLAEVESEFGIALYAAEHKAAKTVGDVIRIVAGHTASFTRRPRR